MDPLGAPITLEELTTALASMKKGKAPGMDSLGAAFYQKFWPEVGSLVHNSLMDAFKTGQLSISQKRGVIQLISRKEKNPHFVRNLWPITLLNLDVKILTKALAIRLKSVLHDLVHMDQQAFVQGRYIRNSVLDLYAMAAMAIDEEDNFIALSLDIEKAFDSVRWDFLAELLARMGFPPEYIRWVDLLQVGKELRVFNNGHLSPPHYGRERVKPGVQPKSTVVYSVHGGTGQGGPREPTHRRSAVC